MSQPLKVALIGANGQLGSDIASHFSRVGDRYQLTALTRSDNDMFMSPIYTYDVARLLDALLQESATGIIHGANTSYCSWHEFASAALSLANIQHPIAAIPAADFPTKATRSMNSVLISEHLPKITNYQMRTWQEALAAYIQTR